MSLIQFEIKHFKLVARCLNQWKNPNGFENNHSSSLPGAAFLCLRQHMVSVIFQTARKGGLTFAHAGILLSLMQWIDEYLVALKDYDYFCSSGYLNGQIRQKVNDVM